MVEIVCLPIHHLAQQNCVQPFALVTLIPPLLENLQRRPCAKVRILKNVVYKVCKFIASVSGTAAPHSAGHRSELYWPARQTSRTHHPALSAPSVWEPPRYSSLLPKGMVCSQWQWSRNRPGEVCELWSGFDGHVKLWTLNYAFYSEFPVIPSI